MEDLNYCKIVDNRYLINKKGEVYSLIGPNGLRSSPEKIKTRIIDGYEKYCFTLNQGKLNTSIHRLVAFTFLGGDFSNKKMVVNHIDGNKLNNSLDNLEIVDIKTNVRHAVKLGKFKRKIITSTETIGKYIQEEPKTIKVTVNGIEKEIEFEDAKKLGLV